MDCRSCELCVPACRTVFGVGKALSPMIALETIMRGRTSIVIAHLLSTILKADSILVVKDGVIAEQGTHDELLAKGGVYRELYETQFRKVLDYESGHDGGQQDDAEPEDEAAPEASETPEPET